MKYNIRVLAYDKVSVVTNAGFGFINLDTCDRTDAVFMYITYAVYVYGNPTYLQVLNFFELYKFILKYPNFGRGDVITLVV